MRDRVTVTRQDLVVTYYRGTGKGGQKRNKTSNCVRIQHPASGAMVEATEDRIQQRNQREALRRLSVHPRFVAWYRTQLARPCDFIVETVLRSPEGKEYWVPTADPTLAIGPEDLPL